MRFSNHRHTGTIFQYSLKKLGSSSLDATFSIESYKMNVLMWTKFMASSMKAANHLGPYFLMNSEVYKNTRFENIDNVFNITQKLMKEHSEEILNVRGLEYSSPSWTRSTLDNDQAIKWAQAKACVYADSVLCVGRMEKAKLKISGCIHHIKKLWESMEKQLNSSGEFHQDFRHCLFSRNPERL